MTRSSIAVLMSLLLGGGMPLNGQAIRDRVADVRDGFVRMSFAVREGVCGDGKNFRFERSRNENWEPDCERRPARVVLERRSGEIVDIDTFYGGRWRASAEVTDLGTVAAADAARFFLDLAKTPSPVAEDAVMPATLADSISVWPELAEIGQDRSLGQDVRKAALFWVAQLGDESVVDLLLGIMQTEPDEDVREHAVFALAQHGSDRAVASLRNVVEDGSEEDEVRKNAIFWLGQRGGDIAYLIDAYERIEIRELKEHLLFVYSQRRGSDEALNKLMEVARNDDDRELQLKAVFWLGQTRDPRAVEFLADLIG